MAWIINHTALKAARERCGLDAGELAEGAKVTEKTIRRLERGETEFARPGTVKAIALALGCEKEASGMWVDYGEGAAADGEGDIQDENGEALGPLSPRVIEDVATAFRVYDGTRYLMTGKVVAQADLSDVERIALAVARGVGARSR
jgi:transcriptional regulator with XRE-family HTH domain